MNVLLSILRGCDSIFSAGAARDGAPTVASANVLNTMLANNPLIAGVPFTTRILATQVSHPRDSGFHASRKRKSRVYHMTPFPGR